MEHYFSKEPNTKHNIEYINYQIKGIELTFATDSGVFSKSKIDYGTNVLLLSIPSLQGRILDLGCGYGPIGISLGKLNPDSHILMVDINQRAVNLAKRNIEENYVTNAQVLQSHGFQYVEGLFHTIISNPPIRAGKKIIYPLFEQSIEYLEPGGSLYLVIQKKQGAKSAMEKIASIYGNCQAINKKGGYWILHSINEQN